MKRYETINNQEYKIEVNYSLGGINYFTYIDEPRGYYLSVTPVERKIRNGIVSESIFFGSGVKRLVREVKRKSEKQYKLAVEEAKAYEKELLDYLESKRETA